MTELLSRLFVKNHKNVTDPHVRTAYGVMVSLIGIAVNLLLFAAKLVIGMLSGSVSVTADAMNNLTDASSAIVTLVGFKLAEKPADEDHPYGHARFEYLSGLAVAGMMLVIGFEMGKTAFEKILNPEVTVISPVLVGILLCSMAVKGWLYLFNNRLGKDIQSTVLLATAADSRNDAVSTGVILISALVEWFTWWQIDGYMGLLVAAFILYNGCKQAKDTISPLLGEAASPELRRQIVSLMEREDAVLGYHDLMVHDYGPGQRFGSLHVEMSQRLDPVYSHGLIDNLERLALEEFGVHLVIHYDPVVMGDPEVEERRALVVKILTDCDPRLQIHDFRMVRGGTHTNLIFDVVLPRNMINRKKQLEQKLEKAFAGKYRSKTYFVITYDVEEFNTY